MIIYSLGRIIFVCIIAHSQPPEMTTCFNSPPCCLLRPPSLPAALAFVIYHPPTQTTEVRSGQVLMPKFEFTSAICNNQTQF